MSEAITCVTITEQGAPREKRTHGNCGWTSEEAWREVLWGYWMLPVGECLAPCPDCFPRSGRSVVVRNEGASDCPCWKPRGEE
jgi:hypothetical protein